MVGIAMMSLGGLSVLLGVFPRLGGLVLTIFLLVAAMIHFAKRGQLRAYESRVEPALSDRDSHGAREPMLIGFGADWQLQGWLTRL